MSATPFVDAQLADAEARTHWEATTRRIFLDERPRIERSHQEFLESLRRG